MVTVREGGPLFLKVTCKRLRHVPVVERELEHILCQYPKFSFFYYPARSTLILRIIPNSELLEMRMRQASLKLSKVW